MTPKLVLASTSPRRRELLGLLNLPFEVVASRYDESLIFPESLTPSDYVMTLAQGKAEEVAGRLADNQALVLGADTTVALDGRIFNKPACAVEAAQMLRALSGRTHEVYTGMCLVHGKTVQTCFARTEVVFDPISEEAIAAYVAGGEPLDKAGAYGIQGAALAFIPAIHGDYFNVVGLPLELLRELLLPYFPDIAPAPTQPAFPDPIRYGKP